ncbi:MAG TPA: HEAT repeat domain-containing protein [Bryobacteraceae bacterium]|jgi:anti-sigma factor RsiW|nr:HEAT repeat domain-containing protein [Bryobacteraceae bacterium]
MSCDSVCKLIPLYFYGEVTPEEEDQVDQHVHECTACAAELEQQRALAAAFDRRQAAVPHALLEECREDLMAAIAGGAPRQVRRTKGPWTLFLEAMSDTLAGLGRMRQPIGAVLLLAVGFLTAHFTGAGGAIIPGLSTNNAAMINGNNIPVVRDVKAEGDGTVKIQFDRREEVTGRLEDRNIQDLILAGSREEDPAVRVESVGLLKSHVDSPQVLDSLINALTGDPNDGVRLKALDALKPMAGDPRVTKALSQVLLADTNPAVRMQAIDLMVTRRDDSVVGLLQNLMQREDNSGVRSKASKILKDWNASIGSF